MTVSCLAGALTHSVKACKLSLVVIDPCQKFAKRKCRNTWKYGGEALYFRDADGPLLEVVTPGGAQGSQSIQARDAKGGFEVVSADTTK